MTWFRGGRRNIRNLGGKCLDVHGGRNAHMRPVIFWNCHNGANQGWFTSTQGSRPVSYPLPDGRKFALRTRFPGNRAMTMWNRIGGNQYMLRMRTRNASVRQQWFIFDRRTATVRPEMRRNFAVSNLNGQGLRIGKYAVARQFRNQPDQALRWYRGSRRNMRNSGNKCLDIAGARNTENMHLIFWNCHNGLNQAWYVDTNDKKVASYPKKDGRKFQIRTHLRSKRAIFWHERWAGNQYRLRIRDSNPENNRQWFIFDSRTNTIRAHAKRNYVISNQAGQRNRIGRPAVIRPFRKQADQMQVWGKGNRRNVKNGFGKCLDVHGGRDANNRWLIYWNCHNGANQGWWLDTKMTQFPQFPVKNGVLFRINVRKNKMNIFYDFRSRAGREGYRLRIHKGATQDKRNWFVHDSRTHSIRVAKNRNLAVSNEYGRGYQIRRPAVVRRWRNQNDQQLSFFRGQRRNLRNKGGKCLDVMGVRFRQNQPLIWYNCHNGENQVWDVSTSGFKAPRYPIRNNAAFVIKTVFPGNRVLYHDASQIRGLAGNYRLRITTLKAGVKNHIWRFDQRTRTVRSASMRNYAISNQFKQGFRIGKFAVIRPYVHKMRNFQQITWFGGPRRNIRNNAGLCLDIWRVQNRDQQPVTWWHCHNGLNQGWFIQKGGAGKAYGTRKVRQRAATIR